MIHVIAILTAKPGQRETILEQFRLVMPKVHAEEGCIEYGPAVDTAHGIATDSFGPDSFVVIEKWASKEALAAHSKAPHMAEYGAKIGSLIAQRVIHVLEPAG